jgi:LacI family transcriptional regulator
MRVRASIRDIAQQTGLSVATVSFVLNDKPKAASFSEATRARVLEAAAELGYRPNIAARRLRSPERETLFIGIAATSNPRIPLLDAAFAAAQAYADQGLTPIQVTFEPFRFDQLHALPGLMDGSRFNGLIIANSSPADEAFLATHEIAVPAILFLRHIPTCNYIDVTNYESGKAAAEFLLCQGRRHLHVLSSDHTVQANEEKQRGFAQALQELGLPLKVTRAPSTESGGCQAMSAVLCSGHPCDGVFAISDHMAVGAMHALRLAGRRIPDDIAIIGHDDRDVARYAAPPLTTFRMPLAQMAKDAVSALVGILTGETNGLVQRTYPTELVVRQST